MLLRLLLLLTVLPGLGACKYKNPNLTDTGKDQIKSLELDHQMDEMGIVFTDLLYVPIYSDIYVDEVNQRTLIAATLSIRNTSFTDSIFISKIDYYNTDGGLVRSYIDKMISLPAMATLNYVIKKEDDTGGSGANFIVELSYRNKSMNPVVQAIMIGEMNNKGFAFLADAHTINKFE